MTLFLLCAKLLNMMTTTKKIILAIAITFAIAGNAGMPIKGTKEIAATMALA